MGPLYKFGWFDFAYSLQLAVLIGAFFGILLERAGLGNPKKLTAIFYLKDFSVLKVLFTAIVVCMLGLLYFSIFGWIDLGRVYLIPTYIWPQLLGGIVLGIGFIMGGYCPTTSTVGMASGKLDALVFIVGIILGSFAFAELFPLLEGLYQAGSMGPVRLSDVFGIHSGIIALLVCIMAVGAYWFVEKVEGKFGDKDSLPRGSKKIKRSGAALLILLGLILAIINPDNVAEKEATPQIQQPNETQSVDDTTTKAKEPASSEFKIVDDEGC
jgi:hypothetical protein